MKLIITTLLFLLNISLWGQQISFYALTSGGLATDQLKSTFGELIADRYDGPQGVLISGFNYRFEYNQSTGIQENSLDGIKITNTEITLDKQYTKATILDIRGSVMVTSTNTQRLNTSKLPAGVYILQINTQGKSQVIKFIRY